MTKTLRENYHALLRELDCTEEQLFRLYFVPVRIVTEEGEFPFDGKTEPPIAAFIMKLRRRRGGFPIRLNPDERVELLRYVTDDIYYDAREHATSKYQALRALLGANLRIDPDFIALAST